MRVRDARGRLVDVGSCGSTGNVSVCTCAAVEGVGARIRAVVALTCHAHGLDSRVLGQGSRHRAEVANRGGGEDVALVAMRIGPVRIADHVVGDHDRPGESALGVERDPHHPAVAVASDDEKCAVGCDCDVARALADAQRTPERPQSHHVSTLVRGNRARALMRRVDDVEGRVRSQP